MIVYHFYALLHWIIKQYMYFIFKLIFYSQFISEAFNIKLSDILFVRAALADVLFNTLCTYGFGSIVMQTWQDTIAFRVERIVW